MTEIEESSQPDVQYLSYSGWKTYQRCPLEYKFNYIDNLPYTSDPRESLFGSTIGKVFEWFYDRDLWKLPDPTAAALATTREALLAVLAKESFVPDDGADMELLREIERNLAHYVPLGIENIRKYKLLSESTRTEFKLHITYKSNAHDFAIRMGGYADFIHGMKQPWILDGKSGSKSNVDTYQLIWYATQYYLRFHIAPVRLGFIFWLSPEEPLQWVDYEEHDIRHCVKQTYQAAQSIRLKMFDAKPSKRCKYCKYLSACEKGRTHIEAMDVEAKVRINPDESILQLDDL